MIHGIVGLNTEQVESSRKENGRQKVKTELRKVEYPIYAFAYCFS